jgi:hypothetical protein
MELKYCLFFNDRIIRYDPDIALEIIVGDVNSINMTINKFNLSISARANDESNANKADVILRE